MGRGHSHLVFYRCRPKWSTANYCAILFLFFVGCLYIYYFQSGILQQSSTVTLFVQWSSSNPHLYPLQPRVLQDPPYLLASTRDPPETPTFTIFNQGASSFPHLHSLQPPIPTFTHFNQLQHLPPLPTSSRDPPVIPSFTLFNHGSSSIPHFTLLNQGSFSNPHIHPLNQL